MSGFYVQIDVDQSDLDDVVHNLETKLSPAGLAGFLDSVVDPFIRGRIDGRFGSEGDDVSGRWHPLTQATQQIRASYGFPPDHPINVRTGKLHSFLVTNDSEVLPNGLGATLTHPAPGSIDPVTAKKLATAQGGSASPSTPARPVLGVNDNDLLFVTSSLAAFISQDFI